MRVFLAIDLDDQMQQTAMDIIEQNPFTHCHWMLKDNLHLTVRFLNSVEKNDVPALIDGLSQVVKTITPFTIETRGTMLIPPKRPKAFVITCSLNEPLAMLVKGITEATDQLGYARDKGPFLPHITLGHFSSKPEEANSNFLPTPRPQAVKSLTLYQSETTPDKSQYTVLARFDLAEANGA